MDRGIVERAVQALAALNTRQRSEPQSLPVPSTRSVKAVQTTPPSFEKRAACVSPHCAGCCEAEPGVRIHPPGSGPEWREWLLKWEPKGLVQ
jgi:hypothetical protein